MGTHSATAQYIKRIHIFYSITISLLFLIIIIAVVVVVVVIIISSSSIINPFTPKTDQFQISPVASPEIITSHSVETWLFIAYSDERWLYYQFILPTSLIHFLNNRLGERNFDLKTERIILSPSSVPIIPPTITHIPPLLFYHHQPKAAFS